MDINQCWLFNPKSSLYIYKIYMIGFGSVLWHINPCWLFNAKSSSYIYFKCVLFALVGFGLVGFVAYFILIMTNPLYAYILNVYELVYGISTIAGYLMPNPVYTCILNIYDL